MIAFWVVVGRSCIDDGFRDEIRRMMEVNYPGDASTDAMHVICRQLGLRPSLFEIWELVRVFAPFPKGRNRDGKPPVHTDNDDRVHQWMNLMKQAMNGQALPPFLDNQLCEAIGVSTIDTEFMDGLTRAVQQDDTALRLFLVDRNYSLSERNRRFLGALYREARFREAINGFKAPLGWKDTTGKLETTRCWIPLCEPTTEFNVEYNRTHPWGKPGAWKIP